MNGKLCPQCGTRYEGEQRFCPLDGATLIAEHEGDTLAGSVLADRYLMKEKLGEGGMGEVYLAEHVRMKRKVAVKVMRRWLTSDPSAIGRFHREAENASQISHPNVAAVYDFGQTTNGLFYLAMEFVNGESLTKVLDRAHALNHVRAADIVSQVADALYAAHSLGILHRDLKPDNVMLGQTRVGTDQVKLLDFGISRVMGSDSQHLTSTGFSVGTPEWMSPEQISGDQLDARADIYALGLIAFRMLTGEGAFGGGSSQDLLLAKMTRPSRRLSEVLPNITWPKELQEAFDRVLASDPDNRYSDALSFARDFYYATSLLPPTPESEAYHEALSRRNVTPSRGVGTMETPSRPQAGFNEISGVASAITGSSGVPYDTGSETPVPTPPPAFDAASEAGVRVFTPPVVAPVSPDEITAPIPMEAVEEPVESEETHAATVMTDSSESTPIYGGAATAPVPKPRRPWVMGSAVAALVVIAAVMVESLGRKNAATTPSSATAPNADSAARAAATSPAQDTSAAPAATGATNIGLDSVRKISEKSVFRVVGSKGSGSGFLAAVQGNQGTVLTSASFVAAADTASVFLDPSKRLLARVLGIDPKSGLAAVVIPMKYCDRCSPLGLAIDSAAAKAADSIIVLGGPTLAGSRTAVLATVATPQDANGRLIASQRVSSVAGGPVLLPNRWVAGMALPGRTGTSAATITAVRDFLAGSLKDLGRVAAIEILPPTWPLKRVSDDIWREGEARSRTQAIDDMSQNQGAFTVLVMTPQTMAWRNEHGDSVKNRGNPMADESCARVPICDPIEQWPSWRQYISERRVVVVVQVTPREAAPPHFGTRTHKTSFRAGGNFEALALKHDTATVPATPIEARRVYAEAGFLEYTADQRFYSGIYVFQPSDFLDAKRVDIEIYDVGNRDRPTKVTLNEKVRNTVSADLRKILGR